MDRSLAQITDTLPITERDIRRRWRSDTALSSIRIAIDHKLPNFGLMRRAAEELGRLNGWSFEGKRFAPFDLETLQHGLFDHHFAYDKALVVQPYNHQSDWQEIAEGFAADRRYPLKVHVPPIATASFHSPGHATILVFTRPSHRIKWLAEQINGIPPADEVRAA